MHVSCTQCEARYQFAAADIPQEGYLARCRRCGAEFFVRQGPHQSDAAPADAASQTDGPRVAVKGPRHTLAGPPERSVSDRPRQGARFTSAMAETLAAEAEGLHGQVLAGADEDAGRPTQAAPRAAAGDGPRPSLAELLDFGGAHETPWPRPKKAGKSRGKKRSRRSWEHLAQRPESNEPRRSRTRSTLLVGMVCVAFVALGVVVGVMRSKQLHLPTQLPPPLHIVHAPPAAAQAAFARGLATLLQDNDATMAQAAEAFHAARTLDEDYTDAWAGEALVHLFVAQDAALRLTRSAADFASTGDRVAHLAEAQGARAHVMVPDADGDSAGTTDDASGPGGEAHLRALEAASAALKLRALVRQKQDTEAELLGDVQRVQAAAGHAASLLLHANQLLGQTPLLASVMALWYVGDPAAQALVPAQLRVAEQLGAQVTEQPHRSWGGEAADSPPASAPFAALRMLVRARLAAAQRTGPTESEPVVVALEAALRLDDNFRRARWELAQEYLRQGKVEDAVPQLEQLAQADPHHVRAAALLQRLQAAHPNGGRP